MSRKIEKMQNKNENKLNNNRNDGIYTQRKLQGKYEHLISFMDNDTPIKDNKYQNLMGVNVNGNCLDFDNTQKKIAVHDIFMREGQRKYEHVRKGSNIFEMELERERKLHLQELINLQSKVSILQDDNNENMKKMKSQEHLIILLEQKLKQKEQEVIIYESQLEMMSRKFEERKQLREPHKMLVSNEQSNKVLELLRQKYQREMYRLNVEVERFGKQIAEKQKQKRKVMQEMQIMSKGHIEENKLMRQSVSRCQQQFKGWLDESKKEKMELIEKYEQEIREIKKQYYTERFNKADTAISAENDNKNRIKELESKGIQLQNELIITKKEAQILGRINGEITLKLRSFEEDNKHLKAELETQANESKKSVEKLLNLQQKLQAIRNEKENTKRELGATQIQNDAIGLKNKQLQKQVSMMSQKLIKTEQLLSEQKKLQDSENSVTNMNLSLTQSITNLKIKIKNLELELEDLTTQLYAERLQKAKIIEEFQESKTQLRREYELSLESTRKQLEAEMKMRIGKTAIDFEKEQLYLQMFEIERKYELLKSQVITSNQMLKMGEKMAQFYHRKKK